MFLQVLLVNVPCVCLKIAKFILEFRNNHDNFLRSFSKYKLCCVIYY